MNWGDLTALGPDDDLDQLRKAITEKETKYETIWITSYRTCDVPIESEKIIIASTREESILLSELYLNIFFRNNPNSAEFAEYVYRWVPRFVLSESFHCGFILLSQVCSNLEVANLLKKFVRMYIKELVIVINNFQEEIETIIDFVKDLDTLEHISLRIKNMETVKLDVSKLFPIFANIKSFHLYLYSKRFHPYDEIIEILKRFKVQFKFDSYYKYQIDRDDNYWIGLIDSVVVSNVDFGQINENMISHTVLEYLDYSLLVPEHKSKKIISECREYDQKEKDEHENLRKFRIVIDFLRSKIANGEIEIGERRIWMKRRNLGDGRYEETVIKVALHITIGQFQRFINEYGIEFNHEQLHADKTFEMYGFDIETEFEVY